MIDTKTHDCAEEVTWLPCPVTECLNGVTSSGDSKASTSHQCETCQGTGLRFPGLSKECSTNPYHRQGRGIEHLCDCQGRGRVPVDSLEAWLHAADTLGGWELNHYATLPGYKFLMHSFFNLPLGEGDAPLAAISEALCQATKCRTEGETS